MPRMNIGKVIRALRTERGDSLETLAFEVGTDASNLSRIERGLQQPSEDVLKAIAAALESSVAELYALAEGAPLRPGRPARKCILMTWRVMRFRCAGTFGRCRPNTKSSRWKSSRPWCVPRPKADLARFALLQWPESR